MSDEEIVKYAKEVWAFNDCELNIDEDAVVSRADDGAWVQAWVWVDYVPD